MIDTHPTTCPTISCSISSHTNERADKHIYTQSYNYTVAVPLSSTAVELCSTVIAIAVLFIHNYGCSTVVAIYTGQQKKREFSTLSSIFNSKLKNSVWQGLRRNCSKCIPGILQTDFKMPCSLFAYTKQSATRGQYIV